MANAVKVTAYLLYSASFIIFLCTPTQADLLGLGSCPNIAPGTGGALAGTWFEQRRYDSVFQRTLHSVQYTFGPATGALTTLDITAIYKITGRVFQLHGRVTPVPATSTAVYTIEFPTVRDFFPQNFIVLGISGTAWAVLYSCTNYGFVHFLQVVILTGARIPAPADIDAAIAVIRSRNLATKHLIEVDQTFS